MLRSVPRRIPLCAVIRSSQVLTFSRPTPAVRRSYAHKKLPSDNGVLPPIGDFVASPTIPSNSGTPHDPIPHQREEDDATEKLLGDNTLARTEEGLALEGEPIEDVSNKNPNDVEKAYQDILQRKISDTKENPDVERSGHQNISDGTPEPTEQSIMYEHDIPSGSTASGAVNSSSIRETAAMRVPLEEVTGDVSKPAVIEGASKDETMAPAGQPLRADNQITSTDVSKLAKNSKVSEPSRNSILDLFGPEKKSKLRKVNAVAQPHFNPLSSHRLDESKIDLSEWDGMQRMSEPSTQQGIDPDEWSDTKRGDGITEEAKNTTHPKFLDVAQIQEEYRNISRPESRKQELPDHDLDISTSESTLLSRWDYFYPPSPPPIPLEEALHQQKGRVQREQGRLASKDSYDSQEPPEIRSRWPWMYNRDELVELCTNHIMRDGKKATAEKIMQRVFMRLLEHYPRRHPVTVLAEAVDRNAPILRNAHVRQQLKITVVPIPLFERQRIRVGWLSMVKATGKRTQGKVPFPDRLANEVIKVMEGRGAGLPFRIAEHKKAVVNRLNVQVAKTRSKKGYKDPWARL